MQPPCKDLSRRNSSWAETHKRIRSYPRLARCGQTSLPWEHRTEVPTFLPKFHETNNQVDRKHVTSVVWVSHVLALPISYPTPSPLSSLPPEGPWRLADAMVSNKVPVEDTSLVLASNPMSWRWQPGVSSEKWILRLTSHFQVKLLEP